MSGGASPLREDRAFAATPSSPSVSPVPASIPLRNYGMFAGIGGMELGLHRAGIETVAVAETDPYAARVLAKHFPHIPNLGDVTKADPPASANFISAGFPCQDISNAGQRAGITGSRSGLYGHVVRALRVVRPLGALLENVAALLNRGMGTVLGDLAEIGYDTEWHCIPARAVGAPHIRDRVWIYAKPQHPDAHVAGSHRTQEYVNGNAQPAHQQVCLSGPLGQILADAAFMLGDVGNDHASGDCEGSKPLPEPQDGDRDQGTERRQWAPEPNVGRVAHGIPKRVDRLRCLGNAVVPQIPELIGRAILAAGRKASHNRLSPSPSTQTG